MFPIPLKLNLPPNVVEINPVLSLMPITLMELIEKSNPSEKDKFSGSIEPRDVTLSPPNPPLPEDITKKSNKKPRNISTSMETNPQESQEPLLFPKAKPMVKHLPLEELEIDLESMLD